MSSYFIDTQEQSLDGWMGIWPKLGRETLPYYDFFIKTHSPIWKDEEGQDYHRIKIDLFDPNDFSTTEIKGHGFVSRLKVFSISSLGDKIRVEFVHPNIPNPGTHYKIHFNRFCLVMDKDKTESIPMIPGDEYLVAFSFYTPGDA